MKLFKIIGVLALALLTLPMQAQETCASTSAKPYEWPGHNNWLLATNVYEGNVYNFATGVFTPMGDAWTPLQAYEGVAAASDDAGNLIFVTNGRDVMDKNANITYTGLLEGNENGGTQNRGSASQGCMTVRHPLAPFDYYIFTTDDALSGTLGFNYAVMDENGVLKQGTSRLGAIRTTEGLSATFHENGVDIWIACQASGTNNVYAWLLTCDGIDLVNSPVISSGFANCAGNEERGGVSFNWDGTQFVSAHPSGWPDKRFYVADFNKKTGEMTIESSCTPPNAFPYDVTFSPDNSRVIYSDNVGSVYTLDISSGVEATIAASASLIASGGTGHSAIEIGADGNLYRSSLGGNNFVRFGGNLNSGGALSSTNNLVGNTSRGLPTIYIPPAEEPDIQEVGPYCSSLDSVIDLHTFWICDGGSAEDTLYSRNTYSGDGIIDPLYGYFNPSTAGPGTHEIIFEYCDVNDTIWIVVDDCPACDVDIQDVRPFLCVGDDLLLDTMVLVASEDGIWTIDSVPTNPTINALLLEGTDTIFDATNLTTRYGTYKLLFTVTDTGEECADSIYVDVHELPIVDLGNDTAICFGDPAITFDAGIPGVTYDWIPDGETSQTISKDVENEYIVEITDAFGCKDTDSVSLTVNVLPIVDLGNDTAICFGDAAITFDAGNVTSTYLWAPDGEIIQTISKDVEAEYSVEIVDTNGCEAVDTVYLTVNALPIVDLGNDTSLCPGEQVLLDAGTGVFYEWNGNLPSNFQTVAFGDGEVTVVVTNSEGCEGSDTIVITEVNPLAISLGNDTAMCIGDPDVVFSMFSGRTDVTVIGWNDASTGFTLNANTTGDYWLEVDSAGCIASDTVTLLVNALPIVDLGNDTAICLGGPVITFDAGNATAAYLWAPDGEITQTIIKDIESEYSVGIIDTNGCEAADTVYLTVNALPIVDLGNDTAICLGDPAITFDAGNTTATYLWAPGGENTQTILKDVEAEYSVALTDTNGCEGADTVYLMVNTLPIVNLGNDTSICIGESPVTFDAGNLTATYLWAQGGETTQTVVTDVDAEYSVKIVDTNGCEATDTVRLNVNTFATVDLGVDQEICLGDAAITFDAQSPGATYLWAPGGEITQTIDKDVAGEYSVALTDVNGCEGADTVNLIVSALPIVDLGIDKEICIGDPAVSFDAGNVTATYLWNPNGETLQTITTDVDGDYIVVIVDTNGCEGTDTVNLTVNALPIVDLGVDQEICEIDPAVTIDAGNPTADYLWSTGEITATIDIHTDSDFNLVVTDTNGCIERDTVHLKVNAMPTVAVADDEICFGDQAVVFDAGPGFVNYLWSEGTATQDMTTDVAGEYVVAFIDAQGCAGTDTVILTVNALPTPDLGNDQTICADANAITFDAGAYASYSWDSGEATKTIDKDVAGTYTVEVTDANGCNGSDDADLLVIALPTPNVILDVSMCPGMSSTFDAADYDNGNGAFTYAWHDGSTSNTFVASAAGSIWVDITDSYGCTARDLADVSILNNLTVAIVGAPQIEFCTGDNADLIPNYKSVDGYFFTWNEGSTTETINVTTSGTYDVHVDNGAGCEGDATIDVVVNPLPVVTPSVAAICDGEAAIIGNDQGNAYVYSWGTGETSAQITVLNAGTYTQTVTHATQGCVNSTTVDVTVNSNPIPDLGNDIEVCAGTAVTFSDESGTAGLTYLWSTAETTASISPTTTGTITLEVTSAVGCAGSDVVEVSFLNVPTVDLGPDINLCEGETSSVDAGNAGLIITWNTGQTDATFEVSQTNTHIVTVSNGVCDAKDTIDVNVVPLPVSEIDHTLATQLYCFDDIQDRGIVLVAGTSNAYTYAWGTGDTGGTLNVKAAGSYVVTISVGSCFVTDNITLNNYCPSVLNVPNTITPDGDGINDTFNAKGQNIYDYEMYIFNRWGEKIYVSTSMSNDWDGTYKTRDVQVDTYVYKIYYSVEHPDGNLRRKQKVGIVNVLR
jgi:gliding motility-associated-like protein